MCDTKTFRDRPTRPMITGYFVVMSAYLFILTSGTLPVMAQTGCTCQYHGDLNSDGIVDAIDLNVMIAEVFFNDAWGPQPDCPHVSPADYNCDCRVDAQDAALIIDHLFFNGPMACNPCTTTTMNAPEADASPRDVVNTVVVDYSGTGRWVWTPLGVHLINDQPLRGIVVPLVIRHGYGEATLSTVELAYGGRLSDNNPILEELSITNLYAAPDGHCKGICVGDGAPGGFATPAVTSDGSLEVTSLPVGILFARQSIFSATLPAGSDDQSPSLIVGMRGSAPCRGGELIVDTTCVEPSNHLLFIPSDYPTTSAIVPAFTPGGLTYSSDCPYDNGTTSVVYSEVGVEVSNQVEAESPSELPFEFHLTEGPGEVDITTGLWTYIPTCTDAPGFTVVIEVSSCGEGECLPGIPFDVVLEPPQLVLTQPAGLSVHCGDTAVCNVTPHCGYPPYSYVVVAGPGIVDVHGMWSTTTECSALGMAEIIIAISDDSGQADTLTFQLNVTDASCDCPFQSDMDGNRVHDVMDLNRMIDVLFFDGSNFGDTTCSTTRADFNNDTFADANDLNLLIDHLFFGGVPPIDPCGP